MDFNRLLTMPRAHTAAIPVSKPAVAEKLTLIRSTKSLSAPAPAPIPAPKPKAVPQSAPKPPDELMAFIDTLPSRREVAEYFRARVEATNV